MPGQSGNPKGQPPRVRQVRDALRLEFASNELGEPVEVKPGSYRDVARALINKALTGDVSAFTEIANRIDGKVPTPVTGGDDEDAAIRMIHRIERVIIDVNHAQHPDSEAVSTPPEAQPL
jgi:hypothetical protein